MGERLPGAVTAVEARFGMVRLGEVWLGEAVAGGFSMSVTNDRRIVECALLANVFFAASIEALTEADERDIIAALREAAHEPLGVKSPKEQAKLKRRIERALKTATDEVVREGSLRSKGMLVAFHFLRLVNDSGYIVVREGSVFDLAVAKIVAVLEPIATDEVLLNQSAIKQARRALTRLQHEGYFQSVSAN